MTVSGLILIAAVFCLAVSLGNIAGWPRVRRAPDRAIDHTSGKVSILIPARNEEANLTACLDAVLKQGVIVAEVLVYDDHSTDATARIIREYAARDRRVRAVEPSALPAGWCGKNFACWRLAQAATGKWLLFLDADARLAERSARRMIGEMERRNLKLLSCWPDLEMAGFWERALMPMLNFVVFSIFPAPLSLLSDLPSLALAHGACLTFDRESYFEMGGHAAVRDQIFEDTRLAQLWRAKGRRALCLDGQDVVRVRMYSTFGEIWRGFQKNFFPAFQRQVSFWVFLIFHLTVFWLPFMLLLAAPSRMVAGAATAVLLTRLALALRFRHPASSALLHPVAEAILIALGISSWWRCRTGRGVVWKGREYFSTR